MYDYSTLGKVYGAAATLIQLHHCAEALILCSYVSYEVSSAYVIGGGLMQFSSGVLHVQRILMLNGVSLPKTLDMLLKVVLRYTWFHARLWVFPLLMWYNLNKFPIDALHAFLLVAGIALTVMNVLWLVKIWKMKSLSY